VNPDNPPLPIDASQLDGPALDIDLRGGAESGLRGFRRAPDAGGSPLPQSGLTRSPSRRDAGN
jgi:hypothetical protein